MKSVHILFPCSPLEGIRKVDEEFQQEHAAAIKAGLKVFFFDHDHLVKRGEVIFNEYPKGTIVILRGWMLTLEQYTVLHAEFCKEDTRMLTSPQQYESMHYWPKAHEKYPLLRSLSPRCFWTYDKAFSVKHIKQFFGGDPIIVKDHVKSAKGAENAMFIKDSADKREVWTVIENMIKERGNLFQRGIVFKQRVNIRKDDDGNNIEFRAFFYGGHNLSVKPNGCKWDYLRAQMQNTKMPLTDLIRQLAGLDEGFTRWTSPFPTMLGWCWSAVTDKCRDSLRERMRCSSTSVSASGPWENLSMSMSWKIPTRCILATPMLLTERSSAARWREGHRISSAL